MKFRFLFPMLALVSTGLAAQPEAEDNSYEKARMLAGVSGGSTCGPVIELDTWEPLNEADREYCGDLEALSASLVTIASTDELEVSTQESLSRIVYGMASEFLEEQQIVLNGPSLEEVQKWLDIINTSIFGHMTVEGRKKKLYLKGTYDSASRIMTAFNYPSMVEKLTDRDKEMLQVCVNWICANITKKMPLGLRLKKIHDAILDGSIVSESRHDARDVLMDGEGSSRAYASATQLLCSLLGMDCRLVRGRMKKEHCWVMVKVGKEKWFHLDTCGNDPSRDSHGRMYEYCMMTDAEIASDHQWDRSGIYPTTPKMSPYRFYLRNELRRSWQDEDAVSSKAAAEGADDSQALVKKGAGLLRPGGSKQVSARKLPRIPKSKTVEAMADERTCASAEDINAQLESRLQKLDDSTLTMKCASGTPDWRMRQMVAESALSSYAEEYVVEYQKKNIILNFKFAPHRRMLAAAQNPDLLAKLEAAEQEHVKQCQQWVAMYGTLWKSKRQKLRDVYMALIRHFEIEAHESRDESIELSKKSAGLYAQCLYVTCGLMDIPCRMVHGRVDFSYHVWNLVSLEKDKWYHADAALDDYFGCASEHSCKNLLVNDEEMRKTHAWDASEFPASASKKKKK